MSTKKELTEMTKKQLLGLDNIPEFLKASFRVLEGEGFESYDAALNGATIVVSKTEVADSLYNGVMGYAIEGRIKQTVGVTQGDMEKALAADFYVVNPIKEVLVKCNGSQLSEILKEAVKRGQYASTALKTQAGFDGVKDISLRPITEYSRDGKFQRLITHYKHTFNEAELKRLESIIDMKKFDISKLFEYAQFIAKARYYNIESKVVEGFEKEIAAKKLEEETGGFF